MLIASEYVLPGFMLVVISRVMIIYILQHTSWVEHTQTVSATSLIIHTLCSICGSTYIIIFNVNNSMFIQLILVMIVHDLLYGVVDNRTSLVEPTWPTWLVVHHVIFALLVVYIGTYAECTTAVLLLCMLTEGANIFFLGLEQPQTDSEDDQTQYRKKYHKCVLFIFCLRCIMVVAIYIIVYKWEYEQSWPGDTLCRQYRSVQVALVMFLLFNISHIVKHALAMFRR